MLRLFLIRHGETEWNRQKRLQGHSNIKLSSKGLRQAKNLVAHFPFPHVDAIYSSDLARAVETASIIADKLDLSVKKMTDLREMNYGDWEGRRIDELATESSREFGRFFTDPERCQPPRGETFLECQARLMIGIRYIIAEHENQNVVVVSHGAAIRLIIGAALDMPIHRLWAISQSNTAINILRVDDGDFTVELLNGSDHLRYL